MSVSKFWSGSTLFAILSSLINVYTVCHSQQSDWGLHYLPFSVWSGSKLFAIVSTLVGDNTICHSQSDQGLQFLPFSAVWSGSALFPVLSKQYYQGIHCLPFLAVWSGLHNLPFSAVWSRSTSSTLSFAGTVWSGSTLFSILSSLIRVYTVCLSPQQSDKGLHCLPFFLSIIIKVYTVWHSQQSDQGLQYLQFLAVLSGTTLFAILSSLIKVKVHTVILRNSLVRVYNSCQSQKSDLGLHCLPFSAVWSMSTLFAILSSLIGVYTICHSQSDQGLQFFPFSAVWSGSTSLAIFSSPIKVKVYIVILKSSLIRVYTFCHSQHSDQGLYYLPFTAVWSYSTLSFSEVWCGSSLFAILSRLVRVYTVCHSQSDQGLHDLPF